MSQSLDHVTAQPRINLFRWLGDDAMHLDRVSITRCGPVIVGCYGGNTAAGAHKNEDGALVWCAADGSWEWATIVDAHYSAQSAALILTALEQQRNQFAAILSQPVDRAFAELGRSVPALFGSAEFRERCRQVRGEASCIICVRKEQFVWWFAVGDCMLYLLHPDLARLNQFALNQRQFYEWIGHANTFDLAVPCYTSGVRELRRGTNMIVLLTDGVLEYGNYQFEDAAHLYATMHPALRSSATDDVLAQQVAYILHDVHAERGRDSATLIAWRYHTSVAPLRGP